MADIKYKYNEEELLRQLKDYVDATYGEHYADDEYQGTEIIIDMGDGLGFTRGNVVKYLKRYGKKDGWNRKDLMKVLHYALILLYIHDREREPSRAAVADSNRSISMDDIRQVMGDVTIPAREWSIRSFSQSSVPTDAVSYNAAGEPVRPQRHECATGYVGETKGS